MPASDRAARRKQLRAEEAEARAEHRRRADRARREPRAKSEHLGGRGRATAVVSESKACVANAVENLLKSRPYLLIIGGPSGQPALSAEVVELVDTCA